jgi:hypothetical protein
MIAFTFIDSKSLGGNRHPVPIGYEDIAVPATGVVVTLTQENVRKCVGALVNFENGPFRERHDGLSGGVPVINAVSASASGYFRSSGDEYFYGRGEALAFMVILDTTNGATEGMLRVTYYG